MATFDDLRAWGYAVDRKLDDRMATRAFMQRAVGVRHLRDMDPADYDRFIAACQQELGTTERPPSVGDNGRPEMK